MHLSEYAPNQLACHRQPDDFMVPGAHQGQRAVEATRAAARLCPTCPAFAACDRERQRLIAAGRPPRGMVLAGVAYDEVGHVVPTCRQCGRQNIGRKRDSVSCSDGCSRASTDRRRVRVPA